MPLPFDTWLQGRGAPSQFRCSLLHCCCRPSPHHHLARRGDPQAMARLQLSIGQCTCCSSVLWCGSCRPLKEGAWVVAFFVYTRVLALVVWAPAVAQCLQ